MNSQLSIFRGSNGTTGNGNGIGNVSSSNHYGGRSNETSLQNVGSNRVSYTSDQLPNNLMEVVKQFKREDTPMAIVCRT